MWEEIDKIKREMEKHIKLVKKIGREEKERELKVGK